MACSDVGQERIGLRGVSIGAALQAQQGARSGGGHAPSIDRCARSVLLGLLQANVRRRERKAVAGMSSVESKAFSSKGAHLSVTHTQGVL